MREYSHMIDMFSLYVFVDGLHNFSFNQKLEVNNYLLVSLDIDICFQTLYCDSWTSALGPHISSLFLRCCSIYWWTVVDADLEKSIQCFTTLKVLEKNIILKCKKVWNMQLHPEHNDHCGWALESLCPDGRKSKKVNSHCCKHGSSSLLR